MVNILLMVVPFLPYILAGVSVLVLMMLLGSLITQEVGEVNADWSMKFGCGLVSLLLVIGMVIALTLLVRWAWYL